MLRVLLLALIGLTVSACGDKKSDGEPAAAAEQEVDEKGELPEVRRPPADLVELSRKIIETRKALKAETDEAEKARLQSELDKLQEQRRGLLMQQRGR